eukprot:SAG31_NODE_8252_length_1489_cov_1.272662_2_plen_98_part_01
MAGEDNVELFAMYVSAFVIAWGTLLMHVYIAAHEYDRASLPCRSAAATNALGDDTVELLPVQPTAPSIQSMRPDKEPGAAAAAMLFGSPSSTRDRQRS